MVTYINTVIIQVVKLWQRSSHYQNSGSDQLKEYLTITKIKHRNTVICEWKNQLQSTTGKLRLYKKIKNIFSYENYS